MREGLTPRSARMRMGSLLVAAGALSLTPCLAAAQAAPESRRLPGSSDAPGQERRVALVIGNDAYRGVPALKNAGADARAMAAALKDLGFETLLHVDLDRRGMHRAFEDFAGRLSSGTVALLFYAGHGVQLAGQNYLLPIDLVAERESDVQADGIELMKWLARVRGAGARFSLAVVDACRDNPFSGTGRAIGTGRGLAPPTETPQGFMVVYSAGANERALDRLGPSDRSPNGLFTREFLKALQKPGLRVQQVVDEVKQSVIAQAAAAGQDQHPAIYDQSTGTFVFRTAQAQTASGASAPVGVPALAPPPVVGGVDLKDLEEQGKVRKQWGEYQSRMSADFTKTQGFEEASSDAELKAAAWERFATAYATDNPLSPDDDGLRARAKESAARWRREARRLAQVVTPPPTTLSAQVVNPPAATRPSGVTTPSSPGGSSGDVWDSPRDGLRYRKIPAGTFQMGCVPGDTECDSDEKPQKSVRIPRDYWLGETEVTVGSYRRLGRTVPSGNDAGDEHPVVKVDWNEAEAFCESGGGRLPTEEEWERAARGGRDGLKYPWGSSLTHEQANYGKDECCGGLASGRDRWERTSPVGSFEANGYGLKDMIGNVWEWTSSKYDAKTYVLRGGSWYDDPRLLRVSNRNGYSPSGRLDYLGFRCARDAP